MGEANSIFDDIPFIKMDSVSKKFMKKRNIYTNVVNEVSLSMYKGKTLGLIGESGCGKTTIARLISQLYKPDEGKIYFCGNDISNFSKAEKKFFHQKVQMIFQNPKTSLNPCMTIYDILADGVRVNRLCKFKSEEKEKICSIIDAVGLKQYQIFQYPHELSGGQQQRIGIARALLLDPEFLICDEIVSSLDVSVQAQIVNLLLDLQFQKKMAYLFISHDLHLVRHMCDFIAVMYDGWIVEYGDTNEVISNPLHPYTNRLLLNTPSISNFCNILPISCSEIKKDVHHGCVYIEQCCNSISDCMDNIPKLKLVSPNHMVRCCLF